MMFSKVPDKISSRNPRKDDVAYRVCEIRLIDQIPPFHSDDSNCQQVAPEWSSRAKFLEFKFCRQ